MNSTDAVDKKRTFICNPSTIKNVRHWIAGILLDYGAPPPIVNDLVLAASEAVTNSVTHSYESTREGVVDVQVLFMGNDVHVVVRDYGASFATEEFQAPDLSIPHESGYGLFLIRSLVNSVTVVPLERGTEIHMVKNLV
jgi:serine/threonine-protein kinase RsbW